MSANREREKLLGHPGRAPESGHGLISLLLGLPFLGFGVAALNVADAEWLRRLGAPSEPVKLFGATFAGLGGLLLVLGLFAMARLSGDAETRKAFPGEPWRWDRDWDERGATDPRGREVGRILLAAVVFTAVLAPVNWLVFKSEHPFLPMQVALGLFDLSVPALFGFAGYRLVQWARFGTPRLRWDRFPFHPGETVRLRLAPPPGASGFDKLRFTLRCVEEVSETIGPRGGSPRTYVNVCYRLYADAQEWFADRIRAHGGGELPVEFELPSDAPPNALEGMPLRYWELAVESEGEGAPYSAAFLLPVYLKSQRESE